MQTTAPTPVPTRRKSRRRWYLFGGFLLFLVATPTAYYFFAGWSADREMDAIYREMDAVDPNWRWADLVAQLKPPPDDVNSAVQITKVYELLKKTPFNLNAKWLIPPNEPMRYPSAKLTPENAELLRSAFGRLDPTVLEEARRLKDLPEGRFLLDPNQIPLPAHALSRARVPAIMSWSDVIELLDKDAIWRAENGDIEGAAESCQALLNAIHAFKDWPVRWGQFLRTIRQIYTATTIERIVAQGEINEPTLRKLQALLEQEIADDGMYIGLRGERAAAHHTYLRLRAGELSFTEVIDGMGGTGGPTLGRLLNAVPGAVLNEYPDFLRTMNEKVPAAKLRDAERDAAFQNIRLKFPRHGILTNMLRSNISDATRQAEASMRCAVVGLAAERFRLKHDFWPASLDELVKAGFVKEIPTDPSDGQHLRWKPTPTGVIIYCPGYDKVDHGGKLDRSFGNIYMRGVDIGFELWEPRHRQSPAPVIDAGK